MEGDATVVTIQKSLRKIITLWKLWSIYTQRESKHLVKNSYL